MIELIELCWIVTGIWMNIIYCIINYGKYAWYLCQATNSLRRIYLFYFIIMVIKYCIIESKRPKKIKKMQNNIALRTLYGLYGCS